MDMASHRKKGSCVVSFETEMIGLHLRSTD